MAAPGPLTGAIPSIIHLLKQFEFILKKGETHATEKGIKQDAMLNHRLAPDATSIPYHVQAVCNSVVWFIDRIGELEHTSIEDNEETFEQLYARIERTISYLEDAKIDKEAFDAKAEKPFVMNTLRLGSFKWETAREYLTYFVIPNIHFHTSNAYCLLRQQGVPLSVFNYFGEVFKKVE
ncbi:hypothetical protein GGR57DRAFT_391769 [Xylariaceae sp. FL1272]|nr:hypothetical protein GGR57DRAFT_391769 [Xylariaceae sp. FL1272]